MGKKSKTQECIEIQYGLQTESKTCTYMGLKTQNL